MPNLRRLAQRFRSAGISHTLRAINTRSKRRIFRSAPGRVVFGANFEVTEERVFAALGIDGDDAQVLREKIFGSQSASHFLGDPEATAKRCRALFPEAVEKTIQVADDVCAHRFHFLGHSAEFDGTIDWFWCPETGGSWPFLDVVSEKAVYLASDKPGDIKFPWELNRHQYFVTLGKAWQYTRDEKYARAFVDQVRDWLDKNPYPCGQNWQPMMELGIRAIAWLNALWLFRDSEYVVNYGLRPIVYGLYCHGNHLQHWMTEDWLVRSNHIIGESAGLFALGAMLPCFPESEAWREKGLRVFAREIDDQVFDDGVNKEQATGYHRFIVDFILVVVELAEHNDHTVPPILLQRLEAMIAFESDIIGPDGLVPMIGDCDDGRGLYLGESTSFMDFRAWQAVGAQRFGREDMAARADGGNEEALWLLGSERWKAFESISSPEDVSKSRLYRDGGLASLRAGDTAAIMRCGPFGFGGDGASSHSHADLLAPVLYLNGEPLAVDTGTFMYYGDSELREYARRTSGHNTFAPEGVEMARPFLLWDWERLPEVTIDEWEATREKTRFAAKCDTQMGYTLMRDLCVQEMSPQIQFEDCIEATTASGPYVWRLHLAPGIEASVVDGERVHLVREEKAVANVVFEDVDDIDIADSWYSPGYGVREATKQIVAKVNLAPANLRVAIEGV